MLSNVTPPRLWQWIEAGRLLLIGLPTPAYTCVLSLALLALAVASAGPLPSCAATPSGCH